MKKYIIKKGGNYGIINESSWKQITNAGQQNCGIYLSDIHKDKIIKCNNSCYDTKEKLVEEINKQMHIFPTIYETKNERHVLMERFDGDITDLLFKVLPRKILDDMEAINPNLQNDIYLIFRGLMNHTMKNDDSFTYNIELLEKLKESKLTLQTYLNFFNFFKKELNKILPFIQNQILLLHIQLFKLGFSYGDHKFDNFAYKLSPTPIKHLGYNINKSKFFDKYISVYIIDWDSGLSKIYDTNNFNIGDYYGYDKNDPDAEININKEIKSLENITKITKDNNDIIKGYFSKARELIKNKNEICDKYKEFPGYNTLCKTLFEEDIYVEYNQTKNRIITDDLKYSINGQYSISGFSYPINKNIENLPQEIQNILKHEYKLEVPQINKFNTLTELEEYCKNNI